jgi:hypothetical protein
MESRDEPVQKSRIEERKGSRIRKAVSSRFTITVVVIIAVIVLADVAFLLVKQDEGDGAAVNPNLAVAVRLPNAEHQPDTQQHSSQGPTQLAAVPPTPSTIRQATESTQRAIENSKEDSRITASAVKKLSEDLELGRVVTTVSDARVVLSGAARSAEAKSRAGELVKTVSGVRSVENQIVVRN